MLPTSETLHAILILTAVVRHFSPRLWMVGRVGYADTINEPTGSDDP